MAVMMPGALQDMEPLQHVDEGRPLGFPLMVPFVNEIRESGKHQRKGTHSPADEQHSEREKNESGTDTLNHRNPSRAVHDSARIDVMQAIRLDDVLDCPSGHSERPVLVLEPMDHAAAEIDDEKCRHELRDDGPLHTDLLFRGKHTAEAVSSATQNGRASSGAKNAHPV